MTISDSLRDREYSKFAEIGTGSTAVKVAVVSGEIDIGSVSANVEVNAFEYADGSGGNALINSSGVQYTFVESGSIHVTNFDTLGSSFVVTNFSDLGSNVVITNSVIGVSGPATAEDLGSAFWVKNIETGSVHVDNFTDLGSNVTVDNFPSTYPGSVVVTNDIGISGLVFLGSSSNVHVIVCGLSGTNIIPLACTSEGYLITSGV